MLGKGKMHNMSELTLSMSDVWQACKIISSKSSEKLSRFCFGALSSILRTLQERIAERESHPGAEQNKEKNAWEAFWKEWGPKLFVYACSHGSVEAVKFLMELELENGGSDGSLLKEARYVYIMYNFVYSYGINFMILQ